MASPTSSPGRRGRRLRAAVLVLAAAVAAWAGHRALERAIARRVERAGAQHGWRAHVDSVRLRLLPLLRLDGIRVERPGAWSVTADRLDASLRWWGSGLLGRTRLRVGPVKALAPGRLELDVVPTLWDVAGGPQGALRAELRQPEAGLAVARATSGDATRFELRASGLTAGRLVSALHDGAPLLDLGALSGTLDVEAAPPATTFTLDFRGRGVRMASLASEGAEGRSPESGFGQATDVALRLEGSWQPPADLDLPRWRLELAGAALSGALKLVDTAGDPKLDLTLEVERVDFSRLLGTSGLDAPQALTAALPARDGDLGSAALSAHVSGRLADAASFSVTQRLDFKPPPRPLPALERLKGDFTLESSGPSGTRRAILVSPESPDFIAFADVPPLFVRTLLLAEDSSFYSHHGVDLSEVPAAVLTNWARGGAARGASTITQQLAKNLFLSPEKRIGRKLHELCLALLLEATLSKDRLLEIYLNIIEWGPDLYGLRPATRQYFDKEPQALTPAEMALLVSLIPAPVRYQRSLADGTVSPGFRPLVDALLAKLRSVDALDEDEYQAALAQELRVHPLYPAPGPMASRLAEEARP